MMPRHPEDGPSVETEACDLGSCREPWAIEVDRDNGPRSLRLCEEHGSRWLQAEAELAAELEEVAGREHEGENLASKMAPLFGLVRALDTRRFGKVGT